MTTLTNLRNQSPVRTNNIGANVIIAQLPAGPEPSQDDIASVIEEGQACGVTVNPSLARSILRLEAEGYSYNYRSGVFTSPEEVQEAA